MTATTSRSPLDRIPAPVLFVTSGVSQYTGAALAVGLFALMPPHTVAWLRALASAVVLVVLIRPWRVAWDRRAVVQAGVFGLVLVVMNMLFYTAIAFLPLGAVVAIEFAGPALLAAVGSRSGRGRLAAVLAATGVASISLVGLQWNAAGTDVWATLLGLLCAIAAGAGWAWYMVLAGRIAPVRSGPASLAVGSAIAVVALAPVAAPWAGPLLTADLWVWLAALGVGVLSSVIPYLLDQVTILRLGTATFALLNALLPATATVVGLVGLRQQPTLGEVVGLVLVSVAVAIAPARRASGRVDPS